MASEGLANISTQISVSLARRLDAKCDAERKASPGTGSRAHMIRAALEQFLADTPDPKDTAPAPHMSAGRPEAMKGRPRVRRIQPAE